VAVAFTAVIVLASPLKEPTAEILGRTQPNLFDLLIALFAALAGVFAIIRELPGTIVGVAIATALMPPLAVVGYGLATWNLPVLGGALALFVTNFVTIALCATVMARIYGFGNSLSVHQSWLQTVMLVVVFAALAAPLGVSLNRIAAETATVSRVRSLLSRDFGPRARITQLSVDFQAHPIAVHSVVITPGPRLQESDVVREKLERALDKPLTLQLDQVRVDRNGGTLEAQRAELETADASVARSAADRIVSLVAAAAGASPDVVTIDRDRKRASAAFAALPGATIEIYRAIELRTEAATEGWSVSLVPPFEPLPMIRFADGSDVIDDAAREAILDSAWAARRWNAPALRVPGLPKSGSQDNGHPGLAQRRALAIASLLRDQGVAPVAAPPGGRTFTLSVTAL
jgi:outer membrane protein OmpA-like peptidoglycan-associated protein